MKNQLLIDLTNKFIDKELTDEEESQLMNLLNNTENKSYFDSLTQAVTKIEEHKPSEHRINIKEAIMRKIQNQNNKSGFISLSSWLLQIFNGSKMGYAFSFALGGLIVGFIFMIQPKNTEPNDVFLKGVMSNSNFDESYFIEDSSIKGAIQVKHSAEMLILDVNLEVTENIDCELKFDKTQFSIYGVKNIQESGSGRFFSAGNSIRLSNLNNNHYLVFLRSLNENPSKLYASFYDGSDIISNLKIDIKY